MNIMNIKAMVFGVGGQDGYYLSQLLFEKGIEVIGISRHRGNWTIGDVADFQFVESLIKVHRPHFIFHFAANSSTRHDVLFENHNTISTGTLNILESVRKHCPKTKVFLSGSAMQFVNNGTPIDEQTPFEASSPYSVARIQSVYAGRYFRAKFGLKIYVGYFFNHDSPLRMERHVNQKIVLSVKRIAMGSTEKLELGDISVRKEFSFAGDIVEAVWILVNQNDIYEAVIGSGTAYRIQDWLECCFKKINKNWVDYVAINPNFKPEFDLLVSNPAQMKLLGWQPKVDFYQLAEMMMESKTR